MIRNANVRAVSHRIAVTGVGAVSPFGDSCEAFRHALLAGRSAIARHESYAAAGCRSTLAARVREFEASRWISPMKLRRMDATGPLAIVAAQQALADASYALIRAALERKGRPMGANDLLIAAHAAALGYTLVTDNVEEFRPVPGLSVQNWLGRR